jgi:hypothetical protein
LGAQLGQLPHNRSAGDAKPDGQLSGGNTIGTRNGKAPQRRVACADSWQARA